MTTPTSPSHPHKADEPSYVDYEAFLAPDFSPTSFANTLVLATNNPEDLPLDLSTPLSRVLFDAQEVDSHIDSLTTRSAIPLLQYTRRQTDASKRILSGVDAQLEALVDSYKQLEKEVVVRHERAEEVHRVAARLCDTLGIARAVGRCLQLARQLEVQFAECSSDHRALIRCAHTLLGIREVVERDRPGEEGFGLAKVDVMRTLREGVIGPTERGVRDAADKILRDFSVPNSATFAQAEDSRAKLVSALHTLYLLSPVDLHDKDGATGEKWVPRVLVQSLESYMRFALDTSIKSVARGLTSLPSLPSALSELSSRSRDLLALEYILSCTKPPKHPLLSNELQTSTSSPPTATPTPTPKNKTLLAPVLASLETGSLPSYFWRSLATPLATRTQEIASRGGAAARSLRANRGSLGDALRECVERGSALPVALGGEREGENGKGKNWDREIAVIVGSVVNNLGR